MSGDGRDGSDDSTPTMPETSASGALALPMSFCYTPLCQALCR